MPQGSSQCLSARSAGKACRLSPSTIQVRSMRRFHSCAQDGAGESGALHFWRFVPDCWGLRGERKKCKKPQSNWQQSGKIHIRGAGKQCISEKDIQNPQGNRDHTRLACAGLKVPGKPCSWPLGLAERERYTSHSKRPGAGKKPGLEDKKGATSATRSNGRKVFSGRKNKLGARQLFHDDWA